MGLDEVEIEVTGRHRRGPFVRRSEEQVSLARRFACVPFELMLPNAVASDVRLVGALHYPPQGVVEVAIQAGRIEALSPLLD